MIIIIKIENDFKESSSVYLTLGIQYTYTFVTPFDCLYFASNLIISVFQYLIIFYILGFTFYI